jgi:hypothetical protein
MHPNLMEKPMTQSSSRIRSLLGAACLMAAIPAALASPIGYQIAFTYNPGQACIRSFCFPTDPPPGYSGSFSVDSAAVAGGGWIDIAGTISLGKLHRYDGIAGASQGYTALVEFAGGLPIDLALQYNGSYSLITPPPFNFTNSGSFGFHAGGGTWSESDFTYASATNYASTNTAAGHYTISEIPLTVPEPAGSALLAAGLLALAARRQWMRPHRAGR